ncbi:MAG: hypothetical protein V1818_03350 [Candidatus Aenigmatarchaeota archaeon]
MKNNIKYFLLIVLIAIIVIIWFIFSADSGGNYDEFAKCLTENGATMYGTSWCSHCNNQKDMFGSSFKYVDFVDCDQNKLLCDNAGVEGYPTWRIDDSNYPGEKTLQNLSNLSGCEL